MERALGAPVTWKMRKRPRNPFGTIVAVITEGRVKSSTRWSVWGQLVRMAAFAAMPVLCANSNHGTCALMSTGSESPHMVLRLS